MLSDKTFVNEDNVKSPINLGNQNEFTMLELANLVIKVTNSKSRITKIALPLDDPKQRRPDISLAKKTLNWEPNVNLESGIKKTVDYFRALVTE